MPIDSEVITAIRRIVGPDRCRTDREARICYGYDATRQQAMPEAVVTPKTAEAISQVMKVAYKHSVPVYPRGAGSGLTGGAVPTQEGIVLDLCSMNRILTIDPETFVAWVEPGVVLQDLQAAVEAVGLFYPPDPASSDVATIGGTVAECAGGLRCIKYGVTRDYIMALEVVLPTGEIIHTGSIAAKSVTGYDLTRLFVGSEGTLGIFTRIAVRLIPKPEAVETVLAILPDLEGAVNVTNHILESRLVPRALELIDEHCLRAVQAYAPSETLPDTGAVVLVEVDGPAGTLAAPRERIIEICKAAGARTVKWSADAEERDALWSLRRNISPAVYAICARKISEDICVPRNRLLETFRRIDRIGERHGFTIAKYGHAGDGNIHMNLLLEDTEPETLQRAEQAIEDIFRATIELGGTLTGEHGIGNTKSVYLHFECGAVEIELMRRLKRLFDPKNLLNPGKIFTSSAD